MLAVYLILVAINVLMPSMAIPVIVNGVVALVAAICILMNR